MAKELTDDELNLRRKARRRLIGATALALAVVVVLPMVLDREPALSTQDIELRIPNPDKAGEFAPGAALSEVELALSAAGGEAAPLPADERVSAVAELELTESAASVADEAAAALAESAVEPGGAASYAVQVGAYSNPNAARQELERLKKRGFKVYTEPAGNMMRVRIGPYAEREKAESVVKILEESGLHPSIVGVK